MDGPRTSSLRGNIVKWFRNQISVTLINIENRLVIVPFSQCCFRGEMS